MTIYTGQLHRALLKNGEAFSIGPSRGAVQLARALLYDVSEDKLVVNRKKRRAMEFHTRLRALRKQTDFSQRELAERVGIDFTYLSKIENKIVKPPSEAVIRKLAHEIAVKLKMDETKLTDELITTAGKTPSDVAQILASNPNALAYLRSLSGDVTSGT